MAAFRIAAQMIAYQPVEAIEILPHVRRAGCNIYPRRRSKPEHRLRPVQYGQQAFQCFRIESTTYFDPTSNITVSYDDAGQVRSQTDTNSDVTTFAYDTSTDTLLTSITYPAVNGNVFSTTYQSDTETGLPLAVTDFNNQQASLSYDGLLRPTQVLFPNGGKTTYAYTANQTSTHVYQNASTYSDVETLYDGYGRASRIAAANGQGSNPWYQNDTCYNSNGDVGFASCSYQGNEWSTSKVCSGSGDSYTYDALHRPLNVEHADGTGQSFSYTGPASKITDENGVTRIVSMNAPGLLGAVCEISGNGSMPGSGSPANCNLAIPGTGFLTSYSYNIQQHQVTATQGTQTRVFQTDWVGRPILVQEPESGQTSFSYAYNSTGLAITRQRPQANQTNPSVLTTTTSQYDALGRPISISYSDGTPTKTFAYDTSAGANFTDLSQSNLKGRLSLASVANAMTAFSYDATGRISYLDQCLPSGPCGTVSNNRQQHYVFDLAGNLTSSTDGAGVTSTYVVSVADELLSLTSSKNDSTDPPNIVSNVQNGPTGRLNYSLGNGLTGVASYDTLERLNGGWVCNGSTNPSCSGGTQVYGFTSSWKGIQLTGSADSVLNQTSAYGYDEFNRLTSRTVTAGTPQNFSYVYDRWGNRWQQNVTAGTGPAPQLTFNTANNRITSAGFAYDAAGNMTNDSYHTYAYDADGNILKVDSGNTAQYVYDALNRRVRTVLGSTATEFVFNPAGQRVSIWNGTTRSQLQGQYYWGGQRVAYYANSSTHFQHQDWMGTERLRTTYNHAVEGTFASLPFGDAQATLSGSDGDAYHYASLDYDHESSTDHAEFRQYSDGQGRWLSPNPYGGSYDATNPQSMNRYSYAQNLPLSGIDPAGLDIQDCQWSGTCLACFQCGGAGGSVGGDGGYIPGLM